MYTFSYQNIKV